MAKFKRNNLQLKTNQKIQLGNNQESVVKYDGTDLKLTNDGGQLTLDANGIALNSGVSVNQFSDNPTLGSSPNIVPTQGAVKSYVDTQIGLGIETGNHRLSTGDTTAEIVFVQEQGSENYSIGYSIINTVDNPPLLFVSGVFEKSVTGFKVMFSSPMDTDNYELSWIVTDALLGSSSSSSSSRSSSSNSSSSMSSSSSSSAESSSSNSDAPFMGTGWPYAPDYIEVTIGTRWLFANVDFVEDEVLTLKRVGEEGGNAIVYTESGESLAHPITNRLKIKIRESGPTKLWFYWSVAGGGLNWSTAAYNALYNVPYDFKAFWDTSPSFNSYADSDYFDVTTESSFTPLLKYQGEIFKTMTFTNYSYSSSSASSSSTSLALGEIQLVDEIDLYSTNNLVWGDGTYVYAAVGSQGLKSYSVDVNGSFTHIDTYNEVGDYYYGVWGDGTYIYAACAGGGIRTLSVDTTGGLAFIDVDDQGGAYREVWGDGTFIYAANSTLGLLSYSVDGGGNLTYIDADKQAGDYYSVWGDGTFVYASSFNFGIRSYSVDGGGNLTYIDVDDQGSYYNAIWGDGSYVYAAGGANGLLSYSVDGGGNFTLIDSDVQSADFYFGVWGDGTYIYTCGSQGIRSYSVDGGGNLTYIANNDTFGTYNRVWGDGNYVYVAAGTRGLLSHRVNT
jgi:hypothetical protein